MITLACRTQTAGFLHMNQSVFNPEEQQDDTASKIVAGLERISEVFKVLLWEQATAVGLSPIQIQILIFVAYHKPELCTVSHLALEFNITKPTVSDAIRVLEQKNLIIKIRSQEDKRSSFILLTDTGNEIVETTGQFTKPLRQEMSAFDQSELDGLWSTISKLIYQLNRSGILTVQRTCYGCTYYDKDHEGSDYCRLLEMKLLTADIRLDCPEYEEKE